MKIKVPHTLVLLFGMMVFALFLTYVLPQGKFETMENEHGRSVIIPDSYDKFTEKSFLSIWSLFSVLPRAFADSQGIIFFIFIIGGALAVIKSTGVIDAFLGKMLKKFGNQPQLVIIGSMFVFAIGSSTLGMAEEYLPFVSVLIVPVPWNENGCIISGGDYDCRIWSWLWRSSNQSFYNNDCARYCRDFTYIRYRLQNFIVHPFFLAGMTPRSEICNGS